MKLITSLTIDASLLRKLLRLWDEGRDHRNPFAVVLITPLFASPSTLQLIREELKNRRGAVVFFDSGGYYAQQGKISFDDLYRALLEYYRDPANQWADWYVLPDHVPTSADSPDVVEMKVSETITAAKMFYAEMPSHIQERAIPVIQGHTFEQVNRCLDAYLSMGCRYIGFGSFGTNGSNQSVNVADERSFQMVAYLATELSLQGGRLHTFGVSTPPVIYAFHHLGVYSFDSLAWMRSAGYGKVFLPFTRAYNISHRSTRNGALTREEFETIKNITGHTCPFCQDFFTLQQSRLHRALHNLMAVAETSTPLPSLDSEVIMNLIATRSARYYKLLKRIYRGRELRFPHP